VLNGTDDDSSAEQRPGALPPARVRTRRTSHVITGEAPQANGPDNAAPPSGTKPSGGPSLVILCRSLAMAEVEHGIPPLGCRYG